MPFNNIISRADAASLVPTVISNEILTGVVTRNPIMQLARRLPNMSTNQTRLPVMSALATAYFVAGDTGLKQTSEVNWANRFVDAEELAVVVPIPQAVLDDSGFPIWTEVRPQMEEAISVAITQALLYGTNIPATWTVDLNGAAGLVAGALAAGQVLAIAAYADAYEAILGMTGAGVLGAFMAVEANGFAVTGTVAHPGVRGALRNVRDLNGQPIFRTGMADPTRYELDGTPIYFPTDGSNGRRDLHRHPRAMGSVSVFYAPGYHIHRGNRRRDPGCGWCNRVQPVPARYGCITRRHPPGLRPAEPDQSHERGGCDPLPVRSFNAVIQP